jgi:hypothetical protein
MAALSPRSSVRIERPRSALELVCALLGWEPTSDLVFETLQGADHDDAPENIRRSNSAAGLLFIPACVCLLGRIALWTGKTQRLVVDPRNPMRDPRHGLVQLSQGRMAKYDADEVRANVASCRPPVLVFEAVRKHPHPSVCRFAQRRQFEPCKQGFQPSVLKSYSECFIHVEP